MDILWSKETDQSHSIYVDLFASIQEDEQTRERYTKGLEAMRSIITQKDNKISTEKQIDGNKAFDRKNWLEAMKLYTISLCYAKIGTENVGSAFSYRSACFFALKMYKEALVDIELAKKANLPDHVLPKLEQRKQECLKLMCEERQEPEYQPTLNEKFSCLANVVDMKCDSEFGRHLIANTDIPAGKVIFVEENFAVSHLDEFSVCYTCARSCANFLACEQCAKVVFCSRECMNRNQTHSLECGTFFGQMFFLNDIEAQSGLNRIKLIIQTVLNAISTFPNIEQFMEFVKNTLREDPDQLPALRNDRITRYHFFFKLKKRMQYGLEDALDDVKLVFKIMTLLPKIRGMFDSEEKQRFLKQIIAHHLFIISTNSIGSNKANSIYNVYSLFNHACEPNIVASDSGKLKGGKTTRLVKKGEQLFISYLSPIEMRLPKRDRQRILQSGWGFECKCRKCESNE